MARRPLFIKLGLHQNREKAEKVCQIQGIKEVEKYQNFIFHYQKSYKSKVFRAQNLPSEI